MNKHFESAAICEAFFPAPPRTINNTLTTWLLLVSKALSALSRIDDALKSARGMFP